MMIILHDLRIVLYPIRIKLIHLLLGHKLRAQSQGISYSLPEDCAEQDPEINACFEYVLQRTNRYQKDVKFCSCKMITAYLCRRILKSV